MPAIVAWIAAALSSLFASRIGSWIASALLFFGIELATYSFAVTPAITMIQNQFAGVGGDAIGWCAFFNIDKYITVILSAYGAASLKGAFLRKKA